MAAGGNDGVHHNCGVCAGTTVIYDPEWSIWDAEVVLVLELGVDGEGGRELFPVREDLLQELLLGKSAWKAVKLQANPFAKKEKSENIQQHQYYTEPWRWIKWSSQTKHPKHHLIKNISIKATVRTNISSQRKRGKRKIPHGEQNGWSP